MNILVTGGAGYIGSHTCVELLKNNHNIVVVDNLINSKIEVVDKIKQITNKDFCFYKVDVTDEKEIEKIFNKHNFDGIIHFAGLKAVNESISVPLNYYCNNLISTMVLAKLSLKYNVNKFVFSSSATVYGNNKAPFFEDMELLPTTNPYGETKVMCERILKDVAQANQCFSITILRYFNPIGAHESGLIGENPNGIPNNLMPYITQVAKGKLKILKIYGNDYNTIDGTGMRDYIHVVDLAEGHVSALEQLITGVNIYNLGTGKSTSVLQLVKTFEKVNNVKIPFEIIERRLGDLAECYADVSKAERELKWKAKRGIEEMCLDSWRFEKNLRD